MDRMPPYANPENRRRSIRLRGYNYSQVGAYFITLCTQDREYLFGDIVGGEMVLNPYGEIVADQWGAIPERFPHVDLDEFVVMPNHIHGILVITDTPVGAPLAGAQSNAGKRATARVARTGAGGRSNDGAAAWVGAPLAGAQSNTGAQNAAGAGAITIGDIVGAYKSICVHCCLAWIKTHDIRRRLGKLWQRNYWEHIVRNEGELNRIREYIRNNPVKWELDRLHLMVSPTTIREPVVTYATEGWMV